MYLNELYKEPKKYLDKEITLKGWIRSQRKQKDFGFIKAIRRRDYYK